MYPPDVLPNPFEPWRTLGEPWGAMVGSPSPHLMEGRPASVVVGTPMPASRLDYSKSSRFVNEQSSRFVNEQSSRFVNEQSSRFVNKSSGSPNSPEPRTEPRRRGWDWADEQKTKDTTEAAKAVRKAASAMSTAAANAAKSPTIVQSHA
jgi:hypothetical protein